MNYPLTELGAILNFEKKLYLNLTLHQRINVKSNFGVIRGLKLSIYEAPCISKILNVNY